MAIEISTCEGRVRLAALEEERLFERKQFPETLLESLRTQILQRKVRLDETAASPTEEGSIFGAAVIVAVFVTMVASKVGLPVWATAALAGVGVVVAVWVNIIWRQGGDWQVAALNLGRSLLDVLRQLLLFVAAFGVAVVAPAVFMYYGTGLDEVLHWSGGHPTVEPTAHALVVIRALQLGLIALASLLPALMFFQFRRERFLTIRKRMLHDVFRLDRRLRTLADMKARYGSQLDSLMDSRHGRAGARWQSHNGSSTPLIVATFAITLGWILILLDMSESTGSLNSGALGGLISPDGSAFSFAFLGAYFFSLQVVLRGYIRGDLTPKTYNTVTSRILVALILAWLVGSLTGDDNAVARVVCFVGGIVPETAFRWIRDKSHVQSLAWRDEVAPLTDLEGIDLYDRTRLADEGITNVQALAHHNLVELMLNTRIPVPRLVDWVDQATLYLHVVPPVTLRKGGGDGPGDPEDDGLDLLRTLRAYGIRTATDLIRAVRRSQERGEEPRDLLRELSRHTGPKDRPSRLEVALDVLENDEWIGCLRAWRDIPDGPSILGSPPRPPAPAAPPATVTSTSTPATSTTPTPADGAATSSNGEGQMTTDSLVTTASSTPAAQPSMVGVT